ncbi:type II secretion system GspH family protein [[Clostridium] innocuum]|nr:type II secretion system GspH family protein [[Clostridium] innocuum]
MGNKGMTLLETIVSILILSIAGLIFISGFTTVLNTFQKAESVKNQSDAVYSAIHQGGSASVKKKGKRFPIQYPETEKQSPSHRPLCAIIWHRRMSVFQ